MDFQNIFYTEVDKRTFWIVGYTENIGLVSDQIKMLSDYQKTASEIFGVESDQVMSYVISNSRRYAYMRVFYAVTAVAPKEAYVCDYPWTMDKWIAY